MRSEKVIPPGMLRVLALLAVLWAVSLGATFWLSGSLLLATLLAPLVPCLALVGVVIGSGERRAA